MASGVVNTSFMMGGALGLAVLASVAAARTGGDTSPAALVDGYQAAFVIGTLFAVAAAVVAGVFLRGGPAPAMDPRCDGRNRNGGGLMLQGQQGVLGLLGRRRPEGEAVLRRDARAGRRRRRWAGSRSSSPAASRYSSTRRTDHAPAAFTVLNFPVDDIEQAVDRLTAAGVPFERYDGFEQDEKGIARADGRGRRSHGSRIRPGTSSRCSEDA